MTVRFDREYELKEGGIARYYTVGTWGFEYIVNADGSVDTDSDADVEYAEQAIAAWTEWRDWLKENLPPEPKPWDNAQPGEVWLFRAASRDALGWVAKDGTWDIIDPRGNLIPEASDPISALMESGYDFTDTAAERLK